MIILFYLFFDLNHRQSSHHSRVIVCLTLPQINDFCDLLGTLYAPVTKIAHAKNKIQAKQPEMLIIWEDG